MCRSSVPFRQIKEADRTLLVRTPTSILMMGHGGKREKLDSPPGCSRRRFCFCHWACMGPCAPQNSALKIGDPEIS